MKAICVLHQNKYKGYILFTELKNYTKIEVKLSGLSPGKRGFIFTKKEI